MKYWNRESWLASGTKAQREKWATQLPLAWALEYQPTILLPGKGYIPYEPWEFQQDFLMCREKYRAINKPRQCGISTTEAVDVAWEFDNVPGAQIVIISKDKDAAVNFHKYVYQVLKSVRKNNPKAPKLIKENERETTNANGARIVSLASGKESGRSFSATHLVFDELAFIQYAEEIWQAANATLSQTNGRVTAISTPKGKANLFFSIFDAPAQVENGKKTGLNEMGFKTFSYKWYDVPTYNPFYSEYIAAKNAGNKKLETFWIEKARKEGEWYRRNRPKYTTLAWKQEFEGEFDANKGTVFSSRSLERCFRRNYLTEVEDPQGLISEWWSLSIDGKPAKDRLYYTGIDLGRKGDPTVIMTYDVTDLDVHERDENNRILHPAKLVDFKWIEPGTLEWSELERVAITHLALWQPDDAQHDGTGSGDSFSEAVDGYSDPFIFTKESKRNSVTTVQHAFDYAALMLPKIPRLYREHQKYEWEDQDIVQDTVMANCLVVPLFYDGGSEYVHGFERVDFMSEAVPA